MNTETLTVTKGIEGRSTIAMVVDIDGHAAQLLVRKLDRLIDVIAVVVDQPG